MTAEIFCIGTEVLIGDITNTNAAYISKKLSESGINVYYHTVCGDNMGRMKECLSLALNRSDLIITTGGLGPTYDDITKEMVAEMLGLPLVLNEDILAKLEEYFIKSGRVMTENNKKQAYIPKGAVVFPNMHGTADGIAVTKNGKTVIMLPGPPRENKPMLDNQVIPFLAHDTDYKLVSRNVNIFGMGESSVENALADLMKNSKNPTIAPYCGTGEVRLRVTAKGKTEKQALELIQPVIDEIKKVIGEYVYGVDEDSLESVALSRLIEKNMRVSFAESCTGGLISKRFTDIPGASKAFDFGVCTYADEMKMRVLGVNEQTLINHGAVSPETAREMAVGLLKLSGVDIAISTTGIAGPDGGTAEKPVGLVYMGVATKNKVTVTKLLLAQHKGCDRDYIRTLTANHAFKAIIDTVNEEATK